MTSSIKDTIKSYFQTGDKPTQSQFIDFIDSYVDKSGPIGTLESACSSQGTGPVTVTTGTPTIDTYANLRSSQGITVYTTAGVAGTLGALFSTTAQAIAGTDNTTIMNPVLVENAINNFAASATATNLLVSKVTIPRTTLTISSGVITATNSYHTVDTSASVASDNLLNITAGLNGQLLVIRPANTNRTVVLKNGSGNLLLGGSDCTLDNSSDTIILIYDTGLASWIELSRSNNGT